ncbi:N-acetyltransferase [Lentibacillus kapialis]|uniref:N-acetyltransferase n=1 Tax=Lentibacillus kapialis TaxID=340214 RepID=A0A917PYU6_9BACI|nr:N-acetyltransferase [Lentibacillus kapialis]GGJ99942.1 N-acetyltransferase [Lentibacillus kapialis]
MYNIREEHKNDIADITKVNNSAFEQESEGSMVEAIRETNNFDPHLSLVAETETGEIVGHILFSVVTIATKEGAAKTLALAPMSVKPQYQKQGIGSSLVKQGLRRCKDLGYSSVIVLGHADYYPRFGFIPASKKGIKPPFEVADEFFMVYETKTGALDNVEGTVNYPDAFLDV